MLLALRKISAVGKRVADFTCHVQTPAALTTPARRNLHRTYMGAVEKGERNITAISLRRLSRKRASRHLIVCIDRKLRLAYHWGDEILFGPFDVSWLARGRQSNSEERT